MDVNIMKNKQVIYTYIVEDNFGTYCYQKYINFSYGPNKLTY